MPTIRIHLRKKRHRLFLNLASIRDILEIYLNFKRRSIRLIAVTIGYDPSSFMDRSRGHSFFAVFCWVFSTYHFQIKTLFRCWKTRIGSVSA